MAYAGKIGKKNLEAILKSVPDAERRAVEQFDEALKAREARGEPIEIEEFRSKVAGGVILFGWDRPTVNALCRVAEEHFGVEDILGEDYDDMDGNT